MLFRSGGTERQLLELVISLNKEKYNPLVCCLTEEGSVGKEMQKHGVRVISEKKMGKFDFRVLIKLVRLIKKGNIQIIHTFLFTANFWGRLAAMLTRVPVIIASERDMNFQKRWYHVMVDRFLARHTDKIIFNAKATMQLVEQTLQLAPTQIMYIHNGDRKSVV